MEINKGKLIEVVGDATDPQFSSISEVAIIPHICNDQGGWGRGFVLALSKKWKAPERAYRTLSFDYDNYLMGNVWGFVIDKDGDSCWGFIGDIEDCIKEAKGVLIHDPNI